MPKNKGETKAYTAKTLIDHDREPYAIGEDIALTDAEAAPLLAIQAVELKSAVEAEAAPAKPKGGSKKNQKPDEGDQGEGNTPVTGGEGDKKPETPAA